MKYNRLNSYGDMTVAEKVAERGAASLTDSELLQSMIGSGVSADGRKAIARKLGSVIEKTGVDNLVLDDLLQIKGIGKAKAALIFSALEYWRRKLTKPAAPIIDSPEKAFEQFKDIANKKQEHTVMLTLDGARKLINKHIVSIGTLMASLIHPREVYSLAIEDRAASIIVAHNHPSGSLYVSENDKEVTSRLRQAGDIIGIRFDDHIIVAGDGFISAY